MVLAKPYGSDRDEVGKSLLPGDGKGWVRIQALSGLHENVYRHLPGFV